MNGHSDVVAGAIVFAKTDATFERAARLRTMLGNILGSFEAGLEDVGDLVADIEQSLPAE
jgi:cystathionine gamma-synthase